MVIAFGAIGFREFFVSFGVAPLDTISQLIGMSAVAIVPSYILAVVLRKLFSIRLFYSWIATSLTIAALIVLGANGFSFG